MASRQSATGPLSSAVSLRYRTRLPPTARFSAASSYHLASADFSPLLSLLFARLVAAVLDRKLLVLFCAPLMHVSRMLTSLARSPSPPLLRRAPRLGTHTRRRRLPVLGAAGLRRGTVGAYFCEAVFPLPPHSHSYISHYVRSRPPILYPRPPSHITHPRIHITSANAPVLDH